MITEHVTELCCLLISYRKCYERAETLPPGGHSGLCGRSLYTCRHQRSYPGTLHASLAKKTRLLLGYEYERLLKTTLFCSSVPSAILSLFGFMVSLIQRKFEFSLLVMSLQRSVLR